MSCGGKKAGFFHESHGAEPEHHHSREREGYAHDGGFRHIESCGNNSIFSREVAEQSGDENAAEDNGRPDIVQHRREIKGGAGSVKWLA